MKLLFSALILAGASTLAVAAPQGAEPFQPQGAAQPAPPPLERQMLGRRFVALAFPADRYVAQMRTGMTAMIRAGAQIEGKGTDAEAEAELSEFFNRAEPKIRERLPNLFEAYAQVYAREFSVDELRQMILFAQSPAGQHYLERENSVESDPAVQIQAQGFQLDMLPIMQQLEKERCAAKAAKRVAMGDKKAKCPLAGKSETAAG